MIKALSDFDEIAERFYLAGGTALTLYLGHRISDDIDLFTADEFKSESINGIIARLGGSILLSEKNTAHAMVDRVKVSFFHYPYALVAGFELLGRLKIASVKDIASMKTIAISQRAEKKDFYDLFEILKNIRPNEIRESLIKKFGNKRINCYHILKSLFYFEEAEESPDPVSLNGTTWDSVKKYFLDHEKELSADFGC